MKKSIQELRAGKGAALEPDHGLDHVILMVQAVFNGFDAVLEIIHMGDNFLQGDQTAGHGLDCLGVEVSVTVYRINGSL